jgi:hypothetical protein
MTEAELERWRRDNRYRLSYRPELEPPLKQVPNARLKLSKQRSASLAEGVFVGGHCSNGAMPTGSNLRSAGSCFCLPWSRLPSSLFFAARPVRDRARGSRTLLLSNCVAVAIWRKRDPEEGGSSGGGGVAAVAAPSSPPAEKAVRPGRSK